MTDDTTKVGASDRAQVAAGEDYELDDFARAHGISREDARALIDRVGNDRAKLEAALAEGAPGRKPVARRKRTAAAASSSGTSAAKTTAGKGGSAAAGNRGRASSGSPSKAPARASRSGGRTSAAPPAAAGRSKTQRPAKTGETALAEGIAPIAARTRRAVGSARTRVASSITTVSEATRRTARDTGRRAARLAGDAREAATGKAARIAGIAALGVAAGLAVNLGRKAMVQAPTAMAGDWLEGLKVEHRLALGLFDQLERTADTAQAKRSTLLAQLKHALSKHAHTEENVIYPALRQWGDKADADKLTHDHGYVKQYLYELEGTPKTDPAFLETLSAFRAHLEAHIREEEDAVLPPLHAALGTEGNARVTALANKEGFKLA